MGKANLQKGWTASICHYFSRMLLSYLCYSFFGVAIWYDVIRINGYAVEDPHSETSWRTTPPNLLPLAVKAARKRRKKQEICSTGNGQPSQSADQPFHGCTASVNSGHLSKMGPLGRMMWRSRTIHVVLRCCFFKYVLNHLKLDHRPAWLLAEIVLVGCSDLQQKGPQTCSHHIHSCSGRQLRSWQIKSSI